MQLSHKAYRLAKENDLQGLIRLENICHAIKLSPETRKGSMMMGRQFLQTVQPLNNSELFTIWCEKLKNKEIKSHYPVVYGIYTAMLGVDLRHRLNIPIFINNISCSKRCSCNSAWSK
nr:urease F [Sporosarcina pasteurii]